MVHYFYPAILQCKQEDGKTTYTATMPNFPEIHETESDLGMLTAHLQKKVSEHISAQPTDYPPIELNRVRIKEDEYIVLIEFDELEYRRTHESRSVSRTVTLPFWMDRMAREKKINFSQALHRALKEELGVVE